MAAFWLLLTLGLAHAQTEPSVSGPPSDAPPAPPGTGVLRSPEAPQPVARQGKFALELAKRLGLDVQSSEEEAIRMLQALGIQPDTGWAIDKPATDFFVVQVQKAFVTLLYDVSQRTGAIPPPTLSLSVLTEPFAPQTIYFSPIEQEIIMPDEAAAGGKPQTEDLQVGQLLGANIHSPHPYPAGDDGVSAVWRYTFSHPDASFLKLHFSQLALAGHDYLVIRDQNGAEMQRFEGDIAESGLWTHAVDGDSLVLELYADKNGSAYGVSIDQYVYGQVSVQGAGKGPEE